MRRPSITLTRAGVGTIRVNWNPAAAKGHLRAGHDRSRRNARVRASQHLRRPRAPRLRRSLRAWTALVVCAVTILLLTLAARAQQPFYTDDADVTDLGRFHFEWGNQVKWFTFVR
jgi:hypothetical protein